MTPERLPIVGWVFRFGASDRVLDTLLLTGPLVVLAFVVAGRSIVTELVTALYVLSFVAYVTYLGIGR